MAQPGPPPPPPPNPVVHGATESGFGMPSIKRAHRHVSGNLHALPSPSRLRAKSRNVLISHSLDELARTPFDLSCHVAARGNRETFLRMLGRPSTNSCCVPEARSSAGVAADA